MIKLAMPLCIISVLCVFFFAFGFAFALDFDFDYDTDSESILLLISIVRSVASSVQYVTAFLSFIFASGFDFIPLLISTTRSIASYVHSVTRFLFSVLILTLGLVTSFILIILFYHVTQTLFGRIPSGHFILRHLERRVKTQVKDIRLKEKKAAGQIYQHLEAIDVWDEANNQLLNEIRAAEAIIIGKRVWDWKCVPERNPRSKTVGSTYFVHGRWSPRPPEAPEPSAWSFVRWWRDEEDPRIWAAKAKLTHQSGVLSDKRAVVARLQKENEDLTVKRNETIRKRDTVQWRPSQSKPTKDTWAEKQLNVVNRLVTACNPSQVQQQTNFFRRNVDLTDERIHHCEFCGKDGHRWRHIYDSLVAAQAAPYFRPCPTAAARPRPRPYFVSAPAIGAPSFFDPDVVIAPQHPTHASITPTPLTFAPNPCPSKPLFPTFSVTTIPAQPLFPVPSASIIPANPLFSASEAPMAPTHPEAPMIPTQPLFPAPEAPIVRAQANAPLSSAIPKQASILKVSIAIMASTHSAPQVGHAASSSALSVVPVATSATSSAVATPASIVKTAPAAPKGNGPPSALRVVWPGQSSAGVSSLPAGAISAPIVKTAPTAPKKRGPPSALQVIWPGQTSASPSGAFAPSDLAQTSASRSHEEAAAALAKEEAEARSLEKSAAKRRKKTSEPKVFIEKKNYRF